MKWEDDREGWLWHLFNDPMDQNPWSFVALIVIMVLILWAVFAGTGWLAELRRHKMFNRDKGDRQVADDAIDRARHDRPDEETETTTPRGFAEMNTVTDLPKDELDRLRDGTVPVAGARPTDLPEYEAEINRAVDNAQRYQVPDPVTDSGVHALPVYDAEGPHRLSCTACQGRGYVTKTTSELLRESIALVGDGGDVVVKEFYTRLFRVAPDLAALFPPDLLTAPRAGQIALVDDPTHEPQPPSRGAVQRDRLFSALVALSQTYDPNTPDQMIRLDTALASFGRSHAAFARPDGTSRGATLEEYAAVKAVLFEVLVEAAGPAWITVYTDAWSEAYDYAAGVMLAEAVRGGGRSARFPRA